MKARFYFHEEAIRCNPKDSKEDYIRKFSSFIKDISHIIHEDFEEHEFVSSDNLFGINVFENQNIYDFAIENLDSDTMKILYIVLGNLSENTNLDRDEIEELTIYNPTEEVCQVLFDLNHHTEDDRNKPYIQFDKYELIYNHNSWLTVRRQILGNHPESASNFMKRAKVYFPDINFSDNCELVVGPYLTVVPRKIVYYLSCMNDHLFRFWESHPNKKDINQICAEFAGNYKMDRAGSMQGKPEDKEKYSFEFKTKTGIKSVCCGPHFKITSPDDNYAGPDVHQGDSYHPRIYFNKEDGCIVVGSIGPHL